MGGWVGGLVGWWVLVCIHVCAYTCKSVEVCLCVYNFFYLLIYKIQCIDQAVDRFMYASISVDAFVHG